MIDLIAALLTEDPDVFNEIVGLGKRDEPKIQQYGDKYTDMSRAEDLTRRFIQQSLPPNWNELRRKKGAYSEVKAIGYWLSGTRDSSGLWGYVQSLGDGDPGKTLHIAKWLADERQPPVSSKVGYHRMVDKLKERAAEYQQPEADSTY